MFFRFLKILSRQATGFEKDKDLTFKILALIAVQCKRIVAHTHSLKVLTVHTVLYWMTYSTT